MVAPLPNSNESQLPAPAGRLERLGEKNKSRSCAPEAGITARTSQNGCYLRCRPRSQQGPRGLHRQGRQHQLHDGVAAPRQQVSTARRSERSPASARSFPVVALRRRRRRSATTTGALGEAPGADRLQVYPLRYSPPGALLRDALTRARRARASIMSAGVPWDPVSTNMVALPSRVLVWLPSLSKPSPISSPASATSTSTSITVSGVRV